jgi:hypothetical protein
MFGLLTGRIVLESFTKDETKKSPFVFSENDTILNLVANKFTEAQKLEDPEKSKIGQAVMLSTIQMR